MSKRTLNASRQWSHDPADAATGTETTIANATRSGKVNGIEYDRFGDFEGFALLTEHGEEHLFRATEINVEELVGLRGGNESSLPFSQDGTTRTVPF